jgi:hypothetical protein
LNFNPENESFRVLDCLLKGEHERKPFYYKLVPRQDKLLILGETTAYEISPEDGSEKVEFEGSIQPAGWMPGPPVIYKRNAYMASCSESDTNLYYINLDEEHPVLKVFQPEAFKQP